MSRRNDILTGIAGAAGLAAQTLIDSMPEMFTDDVEKAGALVSCLLSAAATSAVVFGFDKEFVLKEVGILMDGMSEAGMGYLWMTAFPPTEGQA